MRTKAELLSDIPKLQQDIDNYFAKCDASREERELKNGDIHIRQESPSILGLAQYLRVHRNTLTRLIDDATASATADNDDNELVDGEDAQSVIRGIFTYARQEIELRLYNRGINGDASDKIAMMQLARLSGVEDSNVVKVVVQVEGAAYNPNWGK